MLLKALGPECCLKMTRSEGDVHCQSVPESPDEHISDEEAPYEGTLTCAYCRKYQLGDMQLCR